MSDPRAIFTSVTPEAKGDRAKSAREFRVDNELRKAGNFAGTRTDRLAAGEVAGKGAQSGSVGWPQKVQPVGRQIKFSLRLHGAVAYCCFLYAKQG